jgi:hypothetical protein
MTMDDPRPHDRNVDDDDVASAAAGRADLVAQLRQLEAFAARTVSEGDAVPPQATEMIAHLREIVQALDGLTASLAEREARRDAAASPDAVADPEGDAP